MIFYILPYLYTTFLALNYNAEKRLKTYRFWLLILFIFPAILVAILRGNIGTDSYFYLGYFQALIDKDASNFNYEPGYVFICNVLVSLGVTKRMGVAIIAIMTTVLFCKSFSKSKELLVFFCLVVFPIYYVDISMNAIRYGLSFAIALNAIDNFYKNNNKRFIILSLFAISVQYSSLLIILVFLIDKIKTTKLFFLSVALIVSFPILGVFFESQFEYILVKRDSYSQIYSPSLFSGVGPLAIHLLLHFGYIKSVDKTKISKIVYAILLLQITSFILSKYSWAGLRFQGLFLFSLIIYIAEHFFIINKKMFHNVLIVVSIIALFLLIKNLDSTIEDYYYPFLPYKFFWEEVN
jgi:hypothetical protein